MKKSTKEKAIIFFRMLAAGAPFLNVTWGKSKREIIDYFLLAAIALEKDIKQNEGEFNND